MDGVDAYPLQDAAAAIAVNPRRSLHRSSGKGPWMAFSA